MNTSQLLNFTNSQLENFPVTKHKFSLVNRNSLSKKYYQNVIAYDLLLKQNYENIMQLARIDKIILNTTSKSYITDKKYILFTLAGLEILTGQKPQLTFARKSIANFKIRHKQILGCKVVLNENNLYSFLDKLSKIIFPRIRDYQKKTSTIQCNKNKSAWSYGFHTMMTFPELENNYELVENFRGMNLTFVLSNSNKTSCLLVLSGFQLPVFK